MKCGFQDCPGEYEAKQISLALPRQGTTVVIQNVPAEVCSFCGDTQFSAETSRQIDRILNSGTLPIGAVAACDYGQGAAPSNGHKASGNFIAMDNTQRLSPANHRFPGCPGEHDAEVVALLKKRSGQDLLIANVPALVCDTCGSTFYDAHTIHHVEKLLESRLKPSRTAPLYDFAQGAAPQTTEQLVTAQR